MRCIVHYIVFPALQQAVKLKVIIGHKYIFKLRFSFKRKVHEKYSGGSLQSL